MKKNVYKLDNIDCAACGLKVEEGVSKLDGVLSSNLNYMFLKLMVTFDETLVSDEQIEQCIHDSLSGVKIVEKNNNKFIDNYQKRDVFKKVLFRGRKKKDNLGSDGFIRKI